MDRHADRLWPAGVGAIATALFLATFSSNIQFGNSAESVAGVKVTGITHAPGYVSYVLAAKIFTLLEPFGSLAFRCQPLQPRVLGGRGGVRVPHRPADRQ